jgi:hypothetical protein
MTNSDPAAVGRGDRRERGEQRAGAAGGEKEAKPEQSPVEEAQAGPVATGDVSDSSTAPPA